jgi:hypothetical protein
LRAMQLVPPLLHRASELLHLQLVEQIMAAGRVTAEQAENSNKA